MSIWESVPESSLPPGALSLNTYAPNELVCVKGHQMATEADCILPADEYDDWDNHLCRRCVEELS